MFTGKRRTSGLPYGEHGFNGLTFALLVFFPLVLRVFQVALVVSCCLWHYCFKTPVHSTHLAFKEILLITVWTRGPRSKVLKVPATNGCLYSLKQRITQFSQCASKIKYFNYFIYLINVKKHTSAMSNIKMSAIHVA